jgi:protocatechuate 3,4-dioxygenase beta subunit
LESFTSEDGSFRLDDIPEGDWSIAVTADAFLQTGEPPKVHVPGLGEPLVIKMFAASCVRGVVVDPSGKPVAGAHVMRRLPDASDRSNGERSGVGAKCDEKGAFAMTGVPGGAWQLVAWSDAWARSDPSTIQVVAGQHLDALVLHLREGGTLVGEVWDASGARAAGREVQCVSITANEERHTRVDELGAFKFEHLTPGSCAVMIQQRDDRKTTDGSAGSQPVEAKNPKMPTFGACEIRDGEVTHIVLGAPSKSPVKLSGRVAQAGAPVAGCNVIALNEGGNAFQSLKAAFTDASGRYELTLEKPGDIALVVIVKSSGSKGTDFYLTVPSVAEYAFDVDLPVAAIRGTVRGPNGAPIASIPVEIMRDTFGANLMALDGLQSRSTDANGRYSFDGLIPGTYAVAAGGTSGPHIDESTYGRVVRGGLQIDKDRVLDPIELKLTSACTLTGIVRDSNGQPVAGARIFVRDAQGELLARKSTCGSGDTGEFVYRGLAPGMYTVSARAGNRVARESVNVSVQGGEKAHMDLVVDAGVSLRVSAVDKSEKPLKATISVKDERGFELGSILSADPMEDFMTGAISSTDQKFGPLSAGKYVITATTPDGTSGKQSVTLGGQSEIKVTVRVE